MKINKQTISESLARKIEPRLFRVPSKVECHIGLTAFPHVSQTLCGLRLTELERINIEFGLANSQFCPTCVIKLGALAAHQLMIELLK
jgi:hypothetical protein